MKTDKIVDFLILFKICYFFNNESGDIMIEYYSSRRILMNNKR